MESVDTAFRNFQEIHKAVAALPTPPVTEQDVRFHVIDPILVQVLGWPKGSVSNEEHALGGFIDYKLSVETLARLVVEAKRDSRTLGVSDKRAGQTFKLSGPVFKSEAAQEGIRQAVDYCGRKSAELACVTNGSEWIVFRGNRLGDGHDVTDGVAFVFPTLEAISEHFALFHKLLSYDGVRGYAYRAYFQEAEGRPVRLHDFRRSIRAPGQHRLMHTGNLAGDIDRVMASFFERLSGDRDADMLAKCFVVSSESEIADKELARISEDLIGRIRRIDPNESSQLTELVRFAQESQRKQFVVLVGLKGAGKSTFVDRFFKLILPKDVSTDCILIRVNLADAEGDPERVVPWLNRSLLASAEQAVYGGQPATFNEIQGLFFGEYNRLKAGPLAPLYAQDKGKFQLEFGLRVEQIRKDDPHLYIQQIINDVVRSRKKLPVLIFDNTDHHNISLQERVYQYARSIYESQVCMVLLPITDQTSWQMSRQGALQSFEHEAFFLPTPQIYRVIERRIQYLEEKAKTEDATKGRDYFFGRGIRLDLGNLQGFAVTLQRVFVDQPRVSRWIANLANGDVRRALEITRNIVSSPHLGVEELLAAYLAHSAEPVRENKLRRALIRGKYESFDAEQSKYVHNVFDLAEGVETTPLLGLRILQLLRDVPRQEPEGRFIGTDQVVGYFQAIGIEPRATMEWLDALLKRGLCSSYDPTVVDAERSKRVTIRPAGLQHLWWGVADWEYLSAMAEVQPIEDPQVYDELDALCGRPVGATWADRVSVLLRYLVAADRKVVLDSDHESMRSQKRLIESLAANADRVGRPPVTPTFGPRRFGAGR
jgi:GTPase SAR1 family protein